MPTRRGPFLLAALAAVLVVAALVRFDAQEAAIRREAERTAIRFQIEVIRDRLINALTGPLLRTRGMAAEITAHGGLSPETFEQVAQVLLRGHRNVHNIAVSRGTVISMIYPRPGNERALGVDYRTVAHQWPVVKRAIDERRPVIQGPVTLIQGGTGLVIRDPVFLPAPEGGGDHFFGIVSIVLNVEGILADAGIGADSSSLSFAVRGRDGLGAQGEVFFGPPALFADDAVVIDVPFPYGVWQVAAVPRAGWGVGDPGLIHFRLLEGGIGLLVVVAAFGSAAYVNQRLVTTRRLQTLVDELTDGTIELERFAYIAAHDLREPLRTVICFSQLLKKRHAEKLDGDARQSIDLVVEAAARMNDLIGGLLTYSETKDRPVAFEVVDTAAACAAAIEHLQPGIEETGARITLGPLPAVRGDRRQLTLLFQHLIGNAIKFHRPSHPPEITVSAEETPEGRLFAIADNGIGIGDTHQDIFQMFRRLHPANRYPGSGAGLAIAKRVALQHGGRIWYEDNPGGGTIFRVIFPATP